MIKVGHRNLWLHNEIEKIVVDSISVRLLKSFSFFYEDLAPFL